MAKYKFYDTLKKIFLYIKLEEFIAKITTYNSFTLRIITLDTRNCKLDEM